MQALHEEHELTVFDLDESRLTALSSRYDVATIEGNGASRSVLSAAGVTDADLLIACTSRDESNIVAAMITKAIVAPDDDDRRGRRTPSTSRSGARDSSTSTSSSRRRSRPPTRSRGRSASPPRGRPTCSPRARCSWSSSTWTSAASTTLVGVPLREAKLPADSRVAAIIRGDEMRLPGGDDVIGVGDRIVVIGSPQAAQEWSELIAPGTGKVDDVVIYGAGRAGHGDRAAAARAGHRRAHDRGVARAGADRRRRAAAAPASTTRPASTPTSSSGSGSPTPRSRSSPCATT